MPGRSRNTGGRRRPGRVAKSLAAPAVAGLCAALGGILVTATTDLLDDRLSKPVQVLLVALASVLLGLTTWATSRQQREEGRARDGAPAPSQLPPIIAHFTGRDEVLAELHRWFAPTGAGTPGTSSVLTRSTAAAGWASRRSPPGSRTRSPGTSRTAGSTST